MAEHVLDASSIKGVNLIFVFALTFELCLRVNKPTSQPSRSTRGAHSNMQSPVNSLTPSFPATTAAILIKMMIELANFSFVSFQNCAPYRSLDEALETAPEHPKPETLPPSVAACLTTDKPKKPAPPNALADTSNLSPVEQNNNNIQPKKTQRAASLAPDDPLNSLQSILS